MPTSIAVLPMPGIAISMYILRAFRSMAPVPIIVALISKSTVGSGTGSAIARATPAKPKMAAMAKEEARRQNGVSENRISLCSGRCPGSLVSRFAKPGKRDEDAEKDDFPNTASAREQLLDGIWGRDVYIDERTVDVHVGRLRRSLNRGRAPDPIRTVRGTGYAFDERFGRAG